MKLAMVPYYERVDPDSLSSNDPYRFSRWKLRRRDVVDLASFGRARPISRLAAFDGEDRLPEPMVGAIFTKHGTYEQYDMPESDFKNVLGTDLVPSLLVP